MSRLCSVILQICPPQQSLQKLKCFFFLFHFFPFKERPFKPSHFMFNYDTFLECMTHLSSNFRRECHRIKKVIYCKRMEEAGTVAGSNKRRTFTQETSFCPLWNHVWNRNVFSRAWKLNEVLGNFVWRQSETLTHTCMVFQRPRDSACARQQFNMQRVHREKSIANDGDTFRTQIWTRHTDIVLLSCLNNSS